MGEMMMARREGYHQNKRGGGSTGGYRDATSLEEAAREIVRINKKKRFESKQKSKARKPSLPKMPWEDAENG